MTDFEVQQQFQKGVLMAGILLAAIVFGLLLVDAPLMLVLSLAGAAWLLTLPYHAAIALYLGIITYNSALIIPGVPGRPFFWELAAGLGWSGVVVAMALRRQAPGSADRIRRNWPMFLGVIGFSLVLIFLMYYRGVGIKALGSATGGQVGGRLYLQQLACGVFLLLLAIQPLNERILVRLFIWQSILTSTFLLSDFAFAFAKGPLFNLLIFLELPTDGLNFELQSLSFGIRRFQSLFTFTFAMLLVLWVKRPLRDYTNRNGFWMWPLTLILFGVGVMSGHRQIVYSAGVTLLVLAWGQKFYSATRLFFVGFLAVTMYGVVFVYARDMPLSAQRAFSILPGIEVDRVADEDGRATFDGRVLIRRIGWDLSKQYRWIGRGFGKMTDLDPNLYRFDMAYMHVDNGVFYNGTIGLLVNTGLPGTSFMFLLLGSGTMLSLRILRKVRQLGSDDAFLRLCGLQAALWISSVGSFVFLHGDAEFALRSFGMAAGLLVACDWHLRQRQAAKLTEDVSVGELSAGNPLLEPAGAQV